MANFDLANVRQLTKGVNLLFGQAMKQVQKDYLDIATEVNTKSHTVDYTWLGELPAMREWIGLRNFKTLKDYVYTIAKRDWEATISVKRDDFLFDNLGVVKIKIPQLVHSINAHYNNLVFGLIKLNGLAFDGVNFFGTHTLGATSYTNLGTKKLSETALFDAVNFMQGIKDAEGEALDVTPSLLLIAPDLLKAAKTILGSKQISGSDNAAEGLVKYKVVRQMDPGTWCLIDNTKPLKPFLLQITKAGKVEEDATDMFKTKTVHYGVDTMDNAGYGFWQMAYFSDGTVA